MLVRADHAEIIRETLAAPHAEHLRAYLAHLFPDHVTAVAHQTDTTPRHIRLYSRHATDEGCASLLHMTGHYADIHIPWGVARRYLPGHQRTQDERNKGYMRIHLTDEASVTLAANLTRAAVTCADLRAAGLLPPVAVTARQERHDD
ncbi:hypothetical protein Q5762_10845 [Streptomyces sp. P9(2023)]|uniref:hypothetical protein n=1 Tax=Streptomyces sp. P9(2023) TaxID=3064394 RepID=UPI0028F3F465|nr:hypothetical protein [Streptomyces sp. P9(2023)]MDT9688848.1 hypothetical protein [Streptomyces sp. P9(2023)]